jgi:hypothetical protein
MSLSIINFDLLGFFYQFDIRITSIVIPYFSTLSCCTVTPSGLTFKFPFLIQSVF